MKKGSVRDSLKKKGWRERGTPYSGTNRFRGEKKKKKKTTGKKGKTNGAILRTKNMGQQKENDQDRDVDPDYA